MRAEPVAALYERGKVQHAGRFIALEDELTTWTPGAKRSPNRLDALVWAFTELMLNEQVSEAGWLELARESLAAKAVGRAIEKPPGALR